MKITVSEIQNKYKVDYDEFVKFLVDNKYEHKITFIGDLVLEESKIEEYIADFYNAREEESRSAEEAEIEAARKKKALANMLITSGFNFDGYTIKKYSGYISGDDAISVDRGLSFMGIGGDKARDELMASLAKIRRNALRELKEAAYDLGCNAVIGVDFDYITLDPQTHDLVGGTKLQPYVFGVTANGNAVIIEKDED